MKKLRFVLFGVFVTLICAGPASFGGVAAQVKNAPAKIVDFGFSPTDLQVNAGDTVEWTNTGDRPHTVTDRGGSFDTGPVQPNAADSVTFSTPGRYTFFCRINPGKMNGTIDVKAGTEAPKSVRVEATDPTRTPDTPLSFTPSEIEVAAGTPVVLANVGGKPHSLTADDGSFDTGIVVPGAQGGKFAGKNASIVPTEAGKFPFHCEVHPAAMKGVLTVTGESRAGPAAGGAPNKASVDIVDFAFQSDETSVAPGGTVTWKNTGDAPHTATFDDVDLDTSNLEPGSEGALVAPAEPGSYSYRCNVHPAKMRGTLVVVGAGAADPTKADGSAQAAAPAAAKGPGGGISELVLATAVIGAFLGGFGLSAFLRSRGKAQAP
jgi:plastocyanin